MANSSDISNWPLLTWSEFEVVQPDMAKFGRERFQYGVFYLATIGRDSYPRVHPFTPFIGSGHLFAFMYTTSPKGKDLLKNSKYSMHSLVRDMNGTNGEFQIRGEATRVESTGDPRTQMAVEACPYPVSKEKPLVLFEFLITRCMTNYYANGMPNLKSWKETPQEKAKATWFGGPQAFFLERRTTGRMLALAAVQILHIP